MPRSVFSGFGSLDFSFSVSFRVLVALTSSGKFSDITSWTLLFSNSLYCPLNSYLSWIISLCWLVFVIVSACLCSIPCLPVHASLFICLSLLLIFLLRLLLQILPSFLDVLFDYFSNVPIFPCATFFFSDSFLNVFSTFQRILPCQWKYFAQGCRFLEVRSCSVAPAILWPPVSQAFLQRIIHPTESCVVSVWCCSSRRVHLLL